MHNICYEKEILYVLKNEKDGLKFLGEIAKNLVENSMRFFIFTAMNNIEHIGIAVKDLAKSNELFASLLGKPHYKIEEVANESVKTSFFKTGFNKIELLEATKPDSPIAKFIEKKGEGIHHIAFAVDDIFSEIKRLKEEGFTILNEIPKRGADNKLITFIHPKTTNGVLIELCQEIE